MVWFSTLGLFHGDTVISSPTIQNIFFIDKKVKTILGGKYLRGYVGFRKMLSL